MSMGCSCFWGVQPSAVPTTLVSGPLHQLTPFRLAVLWPQAHVPNRGITAREQRDPLQPSIFGLPVSPSPGRCQCSWEREKVSGQG